MSADSLTVIMLVVLGVLILEVYAICAYSGVNKKFDRIIMPVFIATLWFILCCGFVSSIV